MATDTTLDSDNSFEKNVTGNEEFAPTHGELNPAPEAAPVNENKEDGGSEAKSDDKEGEVESNVTVPESNKPAFTVPHPADAGLDGGIGGRSMAVVAPRQ